MKKSLCLLCVACGILAAAAQPFQNLGFDGANTNNVMGGGGDGAYVGPTSELLPGWQGNIPSSMGLNLFPIGNTSYATLVTSNRVAPPFYNDRGVLVYPITGLYHLQLGIWGPATNFQPYFISQTGAVPADANSIQFFAYGSQFELQVNGSLVPLVYDYPLFSLGDPWRPANVAGDISAFAGQTVELKFTTLNDPGVVYKTYGLDGIFFSPQVVPEPGTAASLIVGGLLLLWRKHKQRGD